MQQEKIRSIVTGMTFAAALSASGPALAFGEVAHQAIAAMSAKLVSEKTLQFAFEILRVRPPEVALRRVQLWADRNPLPEISKWKAAPLPAAGGYDKARDCADGACPAEKIAELRKIAMDKSASNDARSDAISFMMHMVGDVHMPKWIAPDAQPQKGVWVKIGDKTKLMHMLWDDEFAEVFGADPLTVMDQLGVRLTPEQEKGWAAGSGPEWQNETNLATREFLAKLNLTNPELGKTEANPIVLSDAQLKDVQNFYGQQIQKAGVRLGWLLDQSAK